MKTLIFILIFSPALCFAALGQGRDSFSSDVQSLGARALVTHQSVMNHPEIHVDTMDLLGITIKEFSDASGQVFALSWHGQRHPGLKGLMAGYFKEFDELDQQTLKGRRFLRAPFVTSQVTVIRGGHVGQFRGLAFINGKLPSGVTADELQ